MAKRFDSPTLPRGAGRLGEDEEPDYWRHGLELEAIVTARTAAKQAAGPMGSEQREEFERRVLTLVRHQLDNLDVSEQDGYELADFRHRMSVLRRT